MGKAWIYYLLMIASIPVLWILLIEITNLPPFLIPPPRLVAEVLWNEFSYLAHHTIVTLQGAALGYLVANLIAIPMAILFIYIPWLEDFATPWMVVIKNIPFVVIASIVVIVLGQNIWPKIIVVVLISFFPIFINVQTGLSEVDNVLIDRMRVLGASKWQVFRHVRWPAALPFYMAAHEIAFTSSVIGAIVAEWLFASEGMGFVILRAMSQYRADRVYAVTLIASVLAVGIYIIVRTMEHRMFRWKGNSNGS